jgi:hypothetical protein
MLSPRGKPEAGAEGEATPDRPTMTPRGTSLLGSLGKLLWSPSGGDTPGLKSPAPGGGDDGMMTQATPRSPGPGTPRSPAPNQASSSSAEAPTPGGAEKKGLLDTLFSPVFTLFSGGAAKPDEKSAAPAAPPPPPPPKPAPAPAPAPAADDDDVDEFDPYTFIRSLPPTAPAAALARPVCLPKKTRGTHPVSLILDLDETLLHSSIVPLPTYDIVFPVHFNSVNYQVYVRKRPHMDYFMNKVSQWFEIIVFTASQKVYADKLLSIIDPQRKWIKHRVFRDSCVLQHGQSAPLWQCPPWQCRRSALAPPHGAPGSSGWLGAPRGEAEALGPQPLPRVLERAASEATDSLAFGHPGAGRRQLPQGPHRARPRPRPGRHRRQLAAGLRLPTGQRVSLR